MTPEREKQIREWNFAEQHNRNMLRDCLDEIDRLRFVCKRAANWMDNSREAALEYATFKDSRKFMDELKAAGGE